MESVTVLKAATAENFEEEPYLRANPDVKLAVEAGTMPSGLVHFQRHGHRLRRFMHFDGRVANLQRQKLARLRPFLRQDMPHTEDSGAINFLTEELRRSSGIVDTANVSSHPYDETMLDVVNEYPEGLLLDCGAGFRDVYFSNVVNYEIVNYETTDILGVAEALPFVDGTFDAIISNAVLEHVRDPFRAAGEIVRVLKPGGKLLCTVPFLQPEHGYPHHYYNMAPQGLRALFGGELTILEQTVGDHVGPIHALTWIIRSWAQGLDGEVKEKFLDMRVSDFMAKAPTFHEADFVTSLPDQKKLELACATTILAVKPPVR